MILVALALVQVAKADHQDEAKPCPTGTKHKVR